MTLFGFFQDGDLEVTLVDTTGPADIHIKDYLVVSNFAVFADGIGDSPSVGQVKSLSSCL